ncbi:PLDc N-terminal domain-containing protein [Rhodococcus triatomae]
MPKQLTLRPMLAAAVIVPLWAGTLTDAVTCRDREVRARRRWIAAIALLPPVGSALWLVFGRPRRPVAIPDQPMHPSMYWAMQRELERDIAAFESGSFTTG